MSSTPEPLATPADADNSPATDSLTGLDMVVALSQKTVNDQLELLYRMRVRPTDSADTETYIPHEVHWSFGPFEARLDAEMDPPTVDLGAGDFREMLFELHLTKGSLTYGVGASKKSIDVAGWTIAFRVALQKLTRTAHTLADTGLTAEARAELARFAAELFEIEVLVMDWQNAIYNELDIQASSFGPIDPSSEEWTVVEALVSGYFKKLDGAANPYVLGASLRSRDPRQTNPVLPDFSPTDAGYSTSPSPDQPELSCLNVLLMNNGHPWPGSSTTGEFPPLVTSSDQQGVMVVSARVFREGYIERVVIPAVQAAIGVGLAATGGGWSGSRASDRESEEDDVVARATSHRVESTTASAGLVATAGDAPGVWVRGKYDFKFTITGDVRIIDFDFPDPTPKIRWKEVLDAWASAWTDWTIGIALSAGADGKILAEPSFSKSSGDDKGSNFVGDLVSWIQDLYDEGIKDVVRSAADAAAGLQADQFEAVKRETAEGMKQVSNVFVLPAGNVFFFKDLRTDGEGNLVTTLTYKD